LCVVADEAAGEVDYYISCCVLLAVEAGLYKLLCVVADEAAGEDDSRHGENW
jgi:hypothetical protein